MSVIGIDPSTSATALVRLNVSLDGKPIVNASVLIKPPNKTVGKRFLRQQFILERIELFLEQNPADLIVIEDYGINMHRPGSIIPLVELGGVIRFFLHAAGYKFLDLKPSLTKQYVCNGGVKKEVLVKRIAKEYGYDPGDDNLSDAFGLGLVGLGFRHEVKLTPEKREVIGKISS